MAKEMVINTSGLNCYKGRVLTAGIDLTQFNRNPILLFMHRRAFDGTLPIGRVENMRIDGDKLIGTPVFDENDPFAKQIADKWEHGFLRMCSAGLEILETSVDPADLLEGQTRATVTRSRLEEVSIVDIGGNDDALQLRHAGKLLTLAADEASDVLPLVELAAPNAKETDNADPSANSNPLNKNKMNKETLQLLGLGENATEQEIHERVKLLKEKADGAERLQLAAIEQAVDTAIAEKRLTGDKRDHFIELGKKAGVESLRETLQLMQPARKPSDVIEQKTDQPAGGEHVTFAKLSEVPADQLEKLRTENRKEYARLYKAEYGVELPAIEK
jgi:hypothetical protein